MSARVEFFVSSCQKSEIFGALIRATHIARVASLSASQPYNPKCYSSIYIGVFFNNSISTFSYLLCYSYFGHLQLSMSFGLFSNLAQSQRISLFPYDHSILLPLSLLILSITNHWSSLSCSKYAPNLKYLIALSFACFSNFLAFVC